MTDPRDSYDEDLPTYSLIRSHEGIRATR